MMDLSKVRNYYIACGYTDLRLGIDGLAAVVTQQYGGQLDEDILFLFCGRRTDRMKALYWTGDGYVLLYKRLSNGKFQWPRSESELRLLVNPKFCVNSIWGANRAILFETAAGLSGCRLGYSITPMGCGCQGRRKPFYLPLTSAHSGVT